MSITGRSSRQIFGFKELQLMEAEAGKKQIREIEELLLASPIPPTPGRDGSSVPAAAGAVSDAACGRSCLMAQQAGQPQPPAPQPPKMIPFGEGPDGQPVEYPEDLLKPSIEVDDLDFHQWEGPCGQDWLSTEACWRELNVGRPGADGVPMPNVAGVANVRLHVKEHLERMAVMMQAQQSTQPHVPPAKPVPSSASTGTSGPADDVRRTLCQQMKPFWTPR